MCVWTISIKFKMQNWWEAWSDHWRMSHLACDEWQSLDLSWKASHIMIWHHVHQILSSYMTVLKQIDLIILHWVYCINHDCLFPTFLLASLFSFTCSSLLGSELVFIIILINLWTPVSSVWFKASFGHQQQFLSQLTCLRSLINVQCHQQLIMMTSTLDLSQCSKLIDSASSFNFYHWQWCSSDSWQLNCS